MTAAANAMVNINRADAYQLQNDLTGVTKDTATRIVEYRKKHGPFRSKDDLFKVDGIARDFVNLNQDYITFGNKAKQKESLGG